MSVQNSICIGEVFQIEV